MKSTPLILTSLDDTGRRLTRIEAKPNESKSESWLQELLYSHPKLLPVDDFDDIFYPAIPIGREVKTDRGPIDNLYVSPEGGITVVETKLWKNPEKHRTVVAQVIDYAKELATWDYDQLCEAVIASSRRRGEKDKASLEEKVAAELSSAGVLLHEFQENVAACLTGGNFLLLIVGDRISPNIALLTKAIQSAPGLGFMLGLAEMQLYEVERGKDWPLIVVPEVIGRTVEKTRGIVQIQYTQEKPRVSIEVDDPGDGDVRSGKVGLSSFLEGIPKDLVQPYKEGIDEWEKLGGTIDFTNKMMFFEFELAGQTRRIVRCRNYQVSVIRPDAIEKWGGNATLHDKYLNDLETSPVAVQHARTGKHWIKYDKMSADDLRAVLRAAREQVLRIKADAGEIDA